MRYFLCDNSHYHLLSIGDKILSHTPSYDVEITLEYKKKDLESDLLNGFLKEISEEKFRKLLVKLKIAS